MDIRIKTLLAIIFLFFPCSAFAETGDRVVLLHGIGRTKITMFPLGAYLSLKDYDVINIDYQSREKPIEELIDDIDKEINLHKTAAEKRIHFVGYSLGGLVIRAYLHKHRPKNIGRVVLIGVPNNGSEVADFLKDYDFYKKSFGPAGQQLTTDQSEIKDLLGKIDYDVGVIAGQMSIDPISSLFLIPDKDDGKVSVESTRLDGMKDHIILNTTHTFMVNNPVVMQQVDYFIEHGKFERDAEPVPLPQ